MPSASSSILDFFPTPGDTPFVIEHIAEEFTSLCPKTGHPDFGTITIRYTPRAASAGGVCVELKSLKLYINSFRDVKIFHEHVVNVILDDFVKACDPLKVEIEGDYHVRGNIKTVVRAEYTRS